MAAQTSIQTTRPIRVAGAIMALAAIGLAYEVTLTRLFSLIFQYHYVFLIVSLAVLGLGIGAGIGQSTRRYASPRTTATVAGITALLLFSVTVGFSQFNSADLTTLAIVIALVPFVALGWLISSLFAQHAEHSALLYGADLLGAVIGLAATLLLINQVGAFGCLLLLSGVMALAAAALYPQSLFMAGAGIVALAALVLTFAGQIEYDPAQLEDAPPDKVMTHVLQNPTFGAELVETRWSPFARVDLVSTSDEALRYVFTDAGAGSVMIQYDPAAPESAAWLRDGADYLPFAMSDDLGRVLILGAGAGKDVVQARLAGAESIVAVEINPTMVDLTNDYASYTGDIYRLPNVDTVVTDGRNYVERADDTFDLIYLNLVYSQAATPGAAALVENYIFTREALTAYWSHLDDDGRIGVVTHNALEGIRLYLAALDMLQEQGYTLRDALNHVTLTGRVIADPQQRRAIIPVDLTLVTIDRTPWTVESITAFRNLVAARGNLSLLYLPHINEELIGGLATGERTLEQYIAGNPEVNYDPTTDDRPFFYHTQPGLPDALRTLVRAVAILGLLYVAFVIVLWNPKREQLGPRLAWLGYFGLIGAGFMLVEIPMIQRFSLLLGAPSLALITVIGGMLLGGSAGSLVSGRFVIDRLPVMIAVAAATTGLLVGISAFVYPALIDAALPAALAARVIVALALLVPLGFVMGIAFPSGLRLVGQADPNGIALHWGANAVASTLGSTLAMVIAMTTGFRAALLIGAGLYLIVAVLTLGVIKNRYAVPQL